MLSKLVLPLELLKEAVTKLPPVRFALGIGGIVAVIAIIFSWNISPQVATFGTIIMLVLMVGLLVFSAILKVGQKRLLFPAMGMLWACVVIIVACASMLFSSFFFGYPLQMREMNVYTPDEDNVWAQKLAWDTLRGNYESMKGYSGPARVSLAQQVEATGESIGTQLRQIPDSNLDENHIILKYEYAALALALAAAAATGDERRQELSSQSIACAQQALRKIDELERQATNGDLTVRQRFTWHLNSRTRERILWYKALSMSVNTKAKGNVTQADAVQAIKSVPEFFSNQHPFQSEPDIVWALSTN